MNRSLQILPGPVTRIAHFHPIDSFLASHRILVATREDIPMGRHKRSRSSSLPSNGEEQTSTFMESIFTITPTGGNAMKCSRGCGMQRDTILSKGIFFGL